MNRDCKELIMEKQKSKFPHVEIGINCTTAIVIIDGVDLSNLVSEYRIVHKAGELPQMELVLAGPDILAVGEMNVTTVTNIQDESNVESYGGKPC